MDKKYFYIGFTVYPLFIGVAISFLIYNFEFYQKTGDMFALLFITINSFLLAYCTMRLVKLFKKWLLYQKYGVKGTWDN